MDNAKLKIQGDTGWRRCSLRPTAPTPNSTSKYSKDKAAMVPRPMLLAGKVIIRSVVIESLHSAPMPYGLSSKLLKPHHLTRCPATVQYQRLSRDMPGCRFT